MLCKHISLALELSKLLLLFTQYGVAMRKVIQNLTFSSSFVPQARAGPSFSRFWFTCLPILHILSTIWLHLAVIQWFRSLYVSVYWGYAISRPSLRTQSATALSNTQHASNSCNENVCSQQPPTDRTASKQQQQQNGKHTSAHLQHVARATSLHLLTAFWSEDQMPVHALIKHHTKPSRWTHSSFLRITL